MSCCGHLVLTAHRPSFSDLPETTRSPSRWSGVSWTKMYAVGILGEDELRVSSLTGQESPRQV